MSFFFGAPHLSKDRSQNPHNCICSLHPDNPRTCPNHAHVKPFIIRRAKNFCCRVKTKQEKSLLLLGTTTAGSLGGLDGLLVALGRTLHAGHEAGGGLEGPLEVAGGRVAEDVDLEQVALEGGLERDDALDQQRVGVLEVEVHDDHHAHAHQLRPKRLLELAHVVRVDRGRDQLALLGGAHRGRLDVFEGGHVCRGAMEVSSQECIVGHREIWEGSSEAD